MADDPIAECRALLDGEAPVIWTQTTVRRLVDVAEAAAKAVAECPKCRGTGVRSTWSSVHGRSDFDCEVCAALRAALSKLGGKA